MSEAFEDVREASKRARASYLWFTLFGFYLAVVVGATTHEQLILGSVMNIPSIQVGLPVKGFYVLVPPILILLHASLLYYLKALTDKVIAAKPTRQQAPGPITRYLVATLSPNNNTQLSEKILIYLIKMGLWLSVFLFPIALIIFIQVRFLPYHHIDITNWHRALLVIELFILWIYWPGIVSPSEENNSNTSSSKNFLQPTVKAIKENWLKRKFLAVALLISIYLSFTIVTIPGEALDRLGYLHDDITTSKCSDWGWLPIFYPAKVEIPTPSGRGPIRSMGCLTYLLFEAPTTPLDMRRNLHLKNTRLVNPTLANRIPMKMTEENIRGMSNRGIDLRGRDLRFAELWGAELQQADLRGADLSGANLHRADLRLADLGNIATSEFTTCRSKPMKYSLKGIEYCRTNLQYAKLRESDLRRSRLWEADLCFADFRYARMQGADFEHSKMAWIDASNARLQGARLSGAKLKGANFKDAVAIGANFAGADFTSQNCGNEKEDFNQLMADASDKKPDLSLLVGEFAIWTDVNFGEANLNGARFNGALMQGAKFHESNLEKAEFFAANLKKATLERIDGSKIALGLANLQGIEFDDQDRDLIIKSQNNALNTEKKSQICKQENFRNGDWIECLEGQKDFLLDQACSRDAGRWIVYGVAQRVIKETPPHPPEVAHEKWRKTIANGLLEGPPYEEANAFPSDDIGRQGTPCPGFLPEHLIKGLTKIAEGNRIFTINNDAAVRDSEQ